MTPAHSHPFALHRTLEHRPLKVLLAGVGGTGSRMALRLSELHKGLVALGRPGLSLHACDPKRVSAPNLVRQAFYLCDVGSFKSEVLITRLNMALGVRWTADVGRAEEQNLTEFDLIVSCLDSAAARRALALALKGRTPYHLDLGNGRDFGQWVLGGHGLPSPYQTLPALLEDDGEDDDTPSCSALESLMRQDLYINETVALFAAQLLWSLIFGSETSTLGGMVNLGDLAVGTLGIPQKDTPT